MLENTLTNIQNAHILVIGDVMLDQYWEGETGRISPEAPVPVVSIAGQSYRAGGAANVAHNISHLGAKVTLMSVIGDDEHGSHLSQLLKGANVNLNFHVQAGLKTISKLRVLSQSQQLIRLDFEQDKEKYDGKHLLNAFESILPKINIVILSDYDKGVLSVDTTQKLISIAKAANKTILVDPKSLDFAKYQNANIITPNWREFTQIAGPCSNQANLEEKAQYQIKKNQLDSLVITRGKDGMSIVSKNQSTQHLPTQAKEVFDVTGAGDTVISVLAVALAIGYDLTQAATFANTAAGIVVGKLGTSTVSFAELATASYGNLLQQSGVVSFKQLQGIRYLLKLANKKLVMTNGCFDILHRGHIEYLRQARELGDYLAVAVNSDQSVKTLKGINRPINSLNDRMELLASLNFVDWVIPFNAQTPLKIYQQLLPDILVKGGDYTREEVVGYHEVITNGGEVKILDFVPNHSTTNTINKLTQDAEVSL